MIREDILQKFPDLFGSKKVNGREVNVEAAIDTLTRELRPEIAAALTARRVLLQSDAPVTGNTPGRTGTSHLRIRSRGSSGRFGRSCRVSSTTFWERRVAGAGG